MRLVLPGVAIQNDRLRCDPTLIKAIARERARGSRSLFRDAPRSLRELAERDGITRRYVRRLVDLAFLSPELTEAILQGRQRRALPNSICRPTGPISAASWRTEEESSTERP
jgi:hypothetical protein